MAKPESRSVHGRGERAVLLVDAGGRPVGDPLTLLGVPMDGPHPFAVELDPPWPRRRHEDRVLDRRDEVPPGTRASCTTPSRRPRSTM